MTNEEKESLKKEIKTELWSEMSQAFQAMQEWTLDRMSAVHKFFKENADLRDRVPEVQQLAARLEREHPNWKLEQVLSAIRKELPLAN